MESANRMTSSGQGIRSKATRINRTQIHVVVIGDHPIMRAGIHDLLELAPDIAVVGEASDDVEALCLVKEKTPDVALLDMEMSEMMGVEIARQLRGAASPMRVLALSAFDDEGYIFELLAIGVAGYVLKQEVLETLVEAVRGVAHGTVAWMSRRVEARMTAWAGRKLLEGASLTERELEILWSVARVGQATGRRDVRVDDAASPDEHLR